MSSTYGSYGFGYETFSGQMDEPISRIINGQIITLRMYKPEYEYNYYPEYERKYYLEEFKRRGWIEDLPTNRIQIEYLQKQTYSKLTLLNANKPYKKAMHHSYYSKRMWATNYGSYL
jgi:hypothetical protein